MASRQRTAANRTSPAAIDRTTIQSASGSSWHSTPGSGRGIRQWRRAIPWPPLFGFRRGEVVWWNHGGTYAVVQCRVVGPGLRPNSLTVSPRTGGLFADVADLFHDTPAYRAWVNRERLEEERLARVGPDTGPVSGLRAAIEALITDNPHLLIRQSTWEGGRPHSRAACLRGDLFIAEAGSAARVETAIRTLADPDIRAHVQAWAALRAETTADQELWLDDDDRVILARVAAFRG